MVFLSRLLRCLIYEEAADNVVELELLKVMFLLICNQEWSQKCGTSVAGVSHGNPTVLAMFLYIQNKESKKYCTIISA